LGERIPGFRRYWSRPDGEAAMKIIREKLRFVLLVLTA